MLVSPPVRGCSGAVTHECHILGVPCQCEGLPKPRTGRYEGIPVSPPMLG